MDWICYSEISFQTFRGNKFHPISKVIFAVGLLPYLVDAILEINCHPYHCKGRGAGWENIDLGYWVSFPILRVFYSVVEVTIDFQDCIYQIRQQAYRTDDFRDRVKFVPTESLKSEFTIADPIHIIPNSYFNKVNFCESIMSAINPSDPRANVTKLRSFINGFVSSESMEEHVSFLKTGNNIVLTLGVEYVIKLPTRYSHSVSIQYHTFRLFFLASVHISPTDIRCLVSRQFSWLYAGAYRDCGVYTLSVAHCDLRLPNIFFPNHCFILQQIQLSFTAHHNHFEKKTRSFTSLRRS